MCLDYSRGQIFHRLPWWKESSLCASLFKLSVHRYGDSGAIAGLKAWWHLRELAYTYTYIEFCLLRAQQQSISANGKRTQANSIYRAQPRFSIFPPMALPFLFLVYNVPRQHNDSGLEAHKRSCAGVSSWASMVIPHTCETGIWNRPQQDDIFLSTFYCRTGLDALAAVEGPDSTFLVGDSTGFYANWSPHACDRARRCFNVALIIPHSPHLAPKCMVFRQYTSLYTPVAELIEYPLATTLLTQGRGHFTSM